MRNRTVTAVARHIASGLEVPWARQPIIARLVREYRAAGYSQAELARRMGVSLRAVQRWFQDSEVKARIRALTVGDNEK